MRELTAAELEFISGGLDPDNEDIIVTGTRQPPTYYYYPPTYYYPPSPPYYGGGGGGTTVPPPTYGTVVPAGGFAGQHVHINATHLTVAEAQAVSDWEKDLNAEAAAINNLPDNAQIAITVQNQDGTTSHYTITGQEYKSIFNQMSYSIVDDSAATGNMTSRGAAQWVNGVPTATFTGQTMQSYESAQGTAGLDYLTMHEIAHLTAAGQAVNTANPLTTANQSTGNPVSENFANSVANAVESYLNLPIMSSYTNGYDSTVHVAVPPPPPTTTTTTGGGTTTGGTTTTGGGGGGGGGTYYNYKTGTNIA